MGKLKQRPPVPIFVERFESDTAAWTAEQVGIYIRLLFYQWINKSIPAEKAALARIARCSQHRFDRAWKTIEQKFVLNIFPKTDELNAFDAPKNYTKTYTNSTMEEVRKNREEYIKNQTLLGYKGQEVKHQKKIEALRVAYTTPLSEPLSQTEATITNTNKDISLNGADAPFQLPTKEELTESSIVKTNGDIENVCKQLYDENIFPDVYAFKNKMLKAKKNEKAILHALYRCYLSKPEVPWPFCKKVLDVEGGNYNEQENIAKSEEFKKPIKEISEAERKSNLERVGKLIKTFIK